VACIRTFAAYTGTVLAARVSGKIKAVVQGTGILVFLGVRATSHFSGYFMQVRRDVFYWVLIPIAVVTAISGVDYVLSNRSAIVDITEDGATD
jgi:phosphatidylglycerophosphate synthase